MEEEEEEEERGIREAEKNMLILAPLFSRLNGDHNTMSRPKGLMRLTLQEALPHTLTMV